MTDKHERPSDAKLGPNLSLSHWRLIDALAEQIAADYLRDLSMQDQGVAPPCTNPAPLPTVDHAA